MQKSFISMLVVFFGFAFTVKASENENQFGTDPSVICVNYTTKKTVPGGESLRVRTEIHFENSFSSEFEGMWIEIHSTEGQVLACQKAIPSRTEDGFITNFPLLPEDYKIRNIVKYKNASGMMYSTFTGDLALKSDPREFQYSPLRAIPLSDEDLGNLDIPAIARDTTPQEIPVEELRANALPPIEADLEAEKRKAEEKEQMLRDKPAIPRPQFPTKRQEEKEDSEIKPRRLPLPPPWHIHQHLTNPRGLPA